MRVILIFSFFFLTETAIMGQEELNIFSFDEYIQIVSDNHPIMFQAQLRNDMVHNTKRMAKGGFDPKIEGSWNHKSFDDKNYYSLANGRLKVPTWYGIDLEAGYDRNNGQFLNESDDLPTRGLWNAGISIPLGKGLVIDNRRAELERADIYQSSTEQEQVKMVNELLFSAARAYLDWQTEYAYLQIAEEGLQLADQRLDGTRISFENGDKPSIDTLESFISLQSREMDLLKNIQNLENAKIAIENFLWINGEVPIELQETVAPEALDINVLQFQIDSLVVVQDQRLVNHPEILLYDFKLKNINLDLRLAKEDVKPDIRVKYNPLVGVADDALFDNLNVNNFKFGTTVSYPILQRKQRGKIQLTKIKSENTLFDRSQKMQSLKMKLDMYINNINQTQNQYFLQTETLLNYNRMLQAENTKLNAGESSIFLVNSRESKYLESRYKQVVIARKLILNKFTYLLYTAGLPEVI